MQLIELQENIWVKGGANIRVIAHEGRCLIIDSGMDKDTGQNILKQVKKLGLIPIALLITHAHADCYGKEHNKYQGLLPEYFQRRYTAMGTTF